MTKMKIGLGLSIGISALAIAASPAAGAPRTDWPAANYDNTAVRYSPLTQINEKNVTQLQQAWIYHLKPADFTGRIRYDESIPIVIGNTMYLGSPYGYIIALNATTGEEKWKFKLPGTDVPAKRGISYWPGDGKLPPSIIFGSTAGFLFSIKASDGTPNAGFGDNGVFDTKTPEIMRGYKMPYQVQGAPVIYKNLVIIGAGTLEGPGGNNGGKGPAGDTRAFDARTGKLVWTFHTVPRPGEANYETWTPDGALDRSGVNVWAYMSLDEKRGILYMPLGAPNNDRIASDRPGPGLYGSSVVAVDANTGKYIWHFQMVHHDTWDFDAPPAPLLVDLKRNGKTVPAIIMMDKASLMFTLNRVTGKPIFDIVERPVSTVTDVPGEQPSPTQPFPVKPEPLAMMGVTRDNLYKGEPQLQSYCEHMVDDNHMTLNPTFTPSSHNGYSLSAPGPAGGVNFWGGTYDPKLHLFVTNVSNIYQPMRLADKPDGSIANLGPLAGLRRFGDPDRHLLCGPTPWGQLVAVNMDTGDTVYRKSLGVSDMLAPEFQNTGRAGASGAFLTASGLTFVGATDDFRFRAFKTATGEQLWETKLPASIEDTPITYKGSDGRQFITAVDTGGGLTGSEVTSDEVIAFALPKK